MDPRSGEEADALRADIERLRTELATKDRELEQARRVIDGALEGVLVVDATGTITSASRRMEELAGVGPGALVGRSGIDLVMPSDLVEVAQSHARLARGEEALFDLRIRRPDALEVWLRSSVTPILQEGQFAGSVTVCLDVTERRRTEERLQKSEDAKHVISARLELLSEASHAFAEAVIDYPRLLSTVAQRASEILGDTCWIRLITADGQHLDDVAFYDPDPAVEAYMRVLNDAIVQRADEGLSGLVITTGEPKLVPRVDADALRAILKPEYRAAAEHVKVASYAIAPLRARGEVFGMVFMARHEAGHPYDESDLALLVDLATRAALAIDNARLYVELEQRVARRTAELKKAFERIDGTNRELEAFSYSVSHDLRAPLRAIDGFSRIVMEDYASALPEECKSLLGRVVNATRRMEMLIDDLLELSRLGRDELVRQPIDLTERARAIAEELDALDPGRRVEWRIAEGLRAEADSRLINVVLENLLANAWKFTGSRAIAHISLDAVELDGALTYVVRDDGAGFDMAYVGKLFGAFQRLHTLAEFAGNGIGLATVKRIIERHGGRIWAEGAVGVGATFCFTLGPGLEAPPAKLHP